MPEAPGNPNSTPKRPWKGVLFPCCGTYGRIYQSLHSGQFEGHCPRCGRKAKLLALLIAFLLWLPAWKPVYAQVAPPNSSTADSLQKANTIQPSDSVSKIDSTAKMDSASTAIVLVLNDTSKSLDSLASPKPPILTLAKDSLVVDSLHFAPFLQAGITFVQFGDRDHFDATVDTLYQEFMALALDHSDSIQVKKQVHQKVNMAFPVGFGILWKPTPNHQLALGGSYWYNREAVIITDKDSRPHEVYYVLQAIPLFAEWKFTLPRNLITLDNSQDFSLLFRWWWLVGSTEIYTSLGSIHNQINPWGNGFSISVGYRIFQWNSLRLDADLGYSSLLAQGNSPWSAVVDEYTETPSQEDAKWQLGGLNMNFRLSFGLLHRATK